MSPEQKAALEVIQKRFTDARERCDPEAMLAALNDPKYAELSAAAALMKRGELKKGGVTTDSALCMVLALRDQMHAMLEIHATRRRQLEERITALERKPHLKYCGVWESARQYNAGDVATTDGSMFTLTDQHATARGRATRGRLQ